MERGGLTEAATNHPWQIPYPSNQYREQELPRDLSETHVRILPHLDPGNAEGMFAMLPSTLLQHSVPEIGLCRAPPDVLCEGEVSKASTSRATRE